MDSEEKKQVEKEKDEYKNDFALKKKILTKSKKEVEKFLPDCVGISVLSSEYASILDTTAAIVKEVDKSIITIAGGVHVTTQYYRVLENKDIDYAIRGEGEYVLRDFLAFLNGEGAFPEKGVVFRNGNGNINALPLDLVQDLDSLPLPNYDLVDYPAYANTGPRYESIPCIFIHMLAY